MTPDRIADRLRDAVWVAPPERPEGRRTGARELLRLAIVLGRDFVGGELNLRAMALAYVTLLALVPLLALSFSILKTFGLYAHIELVLTEYLEPFGEKGAEITAQVIEFVQNVRVGLLGSAGLALLAYASISLVQKIENAFNFIWQVPRSRRLGERFVRDLSLLLVGPLLAFTALGITAAVMDLAWVRGLLAIESLGPAVNVTGRLVPYLLVIAAFTFAYAFMPNTRVRFGPALAGGVVGGVLYQTAGWAFAEFVVASGRYTMIYAGFAILVLFMIWVHVSWLVLLLGASTAFYCQYPQYLQPHGPEARLSNRMRERFALGVMTRVAARHLAGQLPPSLDDITREFRAPPRAARLLVDALKQAGLLAQTGEDPPGFLPARDASLIPVEEIIQAVRSAGETRYLAPAALAVPSRVDTVLRQVDAAASGVLGDLTLRDLAEDPDDDRGALAARDVEGAIDPKQTAESSHR